jgi:hypothetical protein
MENQRYIEVIGSALIVRPVEMQRATIKISVRTRKAETGLKVSLDLREQVITALRSAGIEEALIEDGGCSVEHSTWSSKKHLTHILRIQSKEVDRFAGAMAAVENVFREARTGFFSGIENDFSFVENEPVFAKTEEANELALREAIRNATSKGAILAEQAGLTLGTVVSISEIPRPPRQASEHRTSMEDLLDLDDDTYVGGRGYSVEPERLAYTPVTPRQTTGMVQVRVSFSAAPASQKIQSEPLR